MNKKKNVIISVILTIISILYIYLVKTVDVKPLGPNGSNIGFSTINNYFRNIIGSNMTIYKLTEKVGYLLILLAIIYACLGVYQLIKRKSIKKIDKEIIALGIFYVLVIATYLFFEKVIINYRPVLIYGKLEASFPSSHTMLSLCIGFSSIMISNKYIKKEYIDIASVLTFILMLIVLVGRLISGVHWISDIVGGIIISITLLMYFKTIYNYIK